MDLLTLLLCVSAIVYAIFCGLLKDEAAAYIPKICDKLLTFSVSILPNNLKLIYQKEWEEKIAARPGKLGQFLTALGIVHDALNIKTSIAPIYILGNENKSTLIAEQTVCSNDNMLGTVRWFNVQKGYGFIRPASGDGDVFLHISSLEQAGYDGADEGQSIRYVLTANKQGKISAGSVVMEARAARR